MDTSTNQPTMQDAIEYTELHGTENQRQDVRKTKKAFSVNGFESADFNRFPADLNIFHQEIKKLSGPMPGLQRMIHAAGISENTYRQSWRAGRRLIAEFTGATAEKKARSSQDDAWAELHRRVTLLASTGLVDRFVLHRLPALTDACRLLGLAPTDLSADTVRTLLNVDGSDQRNTLRKGLKALDALREIPRLKDFLPAVPVTPALKRAGRLAKLPEHLQTSINVWVNHAAREQIEDARFDHLAEPLSPSARNRYSAALSLWIETLLKNGSDLPPGTELSEMFISDQIDCVLGRWTTAKTQASRTHYHYTLDLAALLSRHGLSDEASYLAGLTRIMSGLKEGRAAGKR